MDTAAGIPMEPSVQLLPEEFGEAIVLFELEVLPDYAVERDERLRAARALVVGPLLGAASWLVLGGVAFAVIRLLP